MDRQPLVRTVGGVAIIIIILRAQRSTKLSALESFHCACSLHVYNRTELNLIVAPRMKAKSLCRWSKGVLEGNLQSDFVLSKMIFFMKL